MSQDGHSSERGRPEKERSEPEDLANEARPDSRPDSLPALLPAFVVPEPSRDFVEDTLLRIRLDQHVVPDPSTDFVDRVVEAWAREQAGTSLSEPASEELVPIFDLDRHASTEIREQRVASRVPMALALVGLAAALMLAFFIGRQSVTNSGFTDEALVRIEDFPMRGSNRFARSLSLVVDRVDSELLDGRAGTAKDGEGSAYPRPVLSLPAPPSTLIPSGAVELHVDKETLESLGITQENL